MLRKEREEFVKKLLEMKEKDPENFTMRNVSRSTNRSRNTLYRLDKEFNIGFKPSPRKHTTRRIRQIRNDIAKILIEKGFTLWSVGDLLELSSEQILRITKK